MGGSAKQAILQLKETIADKCEHEIVRHEAISALSSVIDKKDFFIEFVNDPSRIVKESALVAMDIIE